MSKISVSCLGAIAGPLAVARAEPCRLGQIWALNSEAARTIVAGLDTPRASSMARSWTRSQPRFRAETKITPELHYGAFADAFVRVVSLRAQARWTTPTARLTDFSFSSILWEQ